MGADRLAQLGLTVQEGAGGPEVVLPLQGSVVNPLTRRAVPAVTLALAEELVIPVDPPELEARLLAGFEEHVARLEAMASRLEALGFAPCVDGERYRFVAARVRGRTFRELLAGPEGRKWADHFQLEDFTGVADVAARALSVSPADISWIEGDER